MSSKQRQPWQYGARYRRARRETLDPKHGGSDLCSLCHHPGADEAHHLVSPLDGGAWYDRSNLAPAHGTKGCPVCHVKCNQAIGRPGINGNATVHTISDPSEEF